MARYTKESAKANQIALRRDLTGKYFRVNAGWGRCRTGLESVNAGLAFLSIGAAIFFWPLINLNSLSSGEILSFIFPSMANQLIDYSRIHYPALLHYC